MQKSQMKNISPAESVYARIKYYIINYKFRPGDQLQISELAEQLVMGKTPLREALTRLHGEALVTSIPNRGFFAKMLTTEEMTARYELSFLILHHAIEKNIARFDLDGIPAPVPPRWEGERIANMTPEFALSHAVFIEAVYERIAALSDNKVMVDNVRNFNDQTRYLRLIELGSPSGVRESEMAIAELIRALESGDLSAAAANLKYQLDSKRVSMNTLVEEGYLRAIRDVIV